MYNPTPIRTPIGRSASPGPNILRNRSPAPNIQRNRSPAPDVQSYYGGYQNPIPAYQTPVPPIGRPISRGPSPVPPGAFGHASPDISGFQVERRAKSPNPYGRPPTAQPDPAAYRDEALYRDQVSALIAAKDIQVAINGRIPVDPAQLVLFFRSKTGITHSLDFPVDVSYNTPPALDVLISSCRPHPTANYDQYGDREALFYPTNLPMTTSLEMSNYPILDAVRSSLFPNLPHGQYLTSVMDRLDVIDNGSYLSQHSPSQIRNDDRAATIVITLPVRFRGGALVVRDADGRDERFPGTGGKNGDIDWVALRSDCTYEIEPVQKGIQLSLSYGIFIKSFGPLSQTSDTLVTPTDKFFDLLSPILNMSRGKSIGFYLNYDYNVNPAEVVADALVPQLKGGDALIYDAFKFHKLAPELHWTAGGYLWPVDHTLEDFVDDVQRGIPNPLKTMPSASPNLYGNRVPFGSAPARGAFGNVYGGNPITGGGGQGHNDDVDALRPRVQASGAVSLQEANITLLTDFNNPSPPIGKERVDFISNGELKKLVVNVLLVVFIP